MENTLLDKYNQFADWVVGKQVEVILKPTATFLEKVVTDVITTLNLYSAEIITLGLVICGGGMMVGSIFGKTNTWVSKLFLVFWGGVIWRILI